MATAFAIHSVKEDLLYFILFGICNIFIICKIDVSACPFICAIFFDANCTCMTLL